MTLLLISFVILPPLVQMQNTVISSQHLKSQNIKTNEKLTRLNNDVEEEMKHVRNILDSLESLKQACIKEINEFPNVTIADSEEKKDCLNKLRENLYENLDNIKTLHSDIEERILSAANESRTLQKIIQSYNIHFIKCTETLISDSVWDCVVDTMISAINDATVVKERVKEFMKEIKTQAITYKLNNIAMRMLNAERLFVQCVFQKWNCLPECHN